MTQRHVSVLIVGAGYAGLTAALMLARRGVSCLVVERRSTLSDHPRAHGLNLRSLELLRQVPGIEADFHRVTRATPGDNTVVIAESVSSPPIKTINAPGGFDTSVISPATLCSAGQDRVEPVLLRHARAQGAEVVFSTELLHFSQGADGVRALLRHSSSGEEETITAHYLIASDGSRSEIRRSLGVDMLGEEGVSHAVSIHFAADLAKALAGRGFLLCYVRNPEVTGAFVTCDTPNTGVLNVEYDPARESPSDFDPVRCMRAVRAAIGEPDLAVELIGVQPWRMSALVAERMRVGRVFLAGDSAHIMPPVGGLAGQAAIQDAADLAWKLAMTLEGRAGPGLLDTYDVERRPVAQLAIARATQNYVMRLREDRVDLSTSLGRTNFRDVALNYRYRSPAISLEEPDDGLWTDDSLRPSGKPGTRLAHVWLMRDGERISTHDLVGDGFLLLAGPDGGGFVEAAENIARRSRIPLTAWRIGVDLADEREDFLARTGLCPDGALLVRPDGFIAWRSVSAADDPNRELSRAIARALCLPTIRTADRAGARETAASVEMDRAAALPA